MIFFLSCFGQFRVGNSCVYLGLRTGDTGEIGQQILEQVLCIDFYGLMYDVIART